MIIKLMDKTVEGKLGNRFSKGRWWIVSINAGQKKITKGYTQAIAIAQLLNSFICVFICGLKDPVSQNNKINVKKI